MSKKNILITQVYDCFKQFQIISNKNKTCNGPGSQSESQNRTWHHAQTSRRKNVFYILFEHFDKGRGVFRNRARGGPTLLFRPIERRSRTFFGLSPISNVKFGLLRGGAMAQWPPPSTRPWGYTLFLKFLNQDYVLNFFFSRNIMNFKFR